MKYSATANLNTYFTGFFNGMESMEREKEYKTGAKLIFEFGQYMDMLARSSPHKYHHVYEWNSIGQEQARLFELTMTPAGNSIVITYKFLPSVVPNNNGQVFTHKATVMESGDTVSFTTDQVVPIGDGEFRTGPFTFKPGGKDTTGAFRDAFVGYFTTKANLILQTDRERMEPSSFTERGGYIDGRRLYDSIRT